MSNFLQKTKQTV